MLTNSNVFCTPEWQLDFSCTDFTTSKISSLHTTLRNPSKRPLCSCCIYGGSIHDACIYTTKPYKLYIASYSFIASYSYIARLDCT